MFLIQILTEAGPGFAVKNLLISRFPISRYPLSARKDWH